MSGRERSRSRDPRPRPPARGPARGPARPPEQPQPARGGDGGPARLNRFGIIFSDDRPTPLPPNLTNEELREQVGVVVVGGRGGGGWGPQVGLGQRRLGASRSQVENLEFELWVLAQLVHSLLDAAAAVEALRARARTSHYYR